MLLPVFSVPKERAAVTAGDDLRGLGYVTNKHFRGFHGNGKSFLKYAILRKIALLAGSIVNY